MSDILSQDELDAMLGAVSGGTFNPDTDADFDIVIDDFDNNFNDFNERNSMIGHCKDCAHVHSSRCKCPDKVDDAVRNMRGIWKALDTHVKEIADRDSFYYATQLLVNTIEDVIKNGVPLPVCPYANGCFRAAVTPESKRGESCAE
jgi:hypothetical protein